MTQTPSGFIGPPTPTSRYMGEEIFAGGAVDETAVPVIFRCAWGPSAQSRHVLVWMKPSVDVPALALRLCQVLGVSTTPAVVIEPYFKWLPGWMPGRRGMDKGIPNLNNLIRTVPRANLPLVLPFAEVVRTMGSARSGVVDLKIITCGQPASGCSFCENRAVLVSMYKRDARVWKLGNWVLCAHCRPSANSRFEGTVDWEKGYVRVTKTHNLGPLICG